MKQVSIYNSEWEHAQLSLVKVSIVGDAAAGDEGSPCEAFPSITAGATWYTVRCGTEGILGNQVNITIARQTDGTQLTFCGIKIYGYTTPISQSASPPGIGK